MKLKGRTAVITGASRGIGFSIAELFAREGAQLALADINNAEIEQAARTIAESENAQTMAVTADVSKARDCEQTINAALDKFGKIDILINNAGITKDGLLIRMAEADWDSVMSINLKGSFLMSKAAAKAMIKQRSGRIVNISSVAGQTGNAGQVNYSASKSGLIGLTKSLARELASRNILVNAVAPGFVNTNMTKNFSEEIKAKLLEAIPLKRFAEPKDIARAALFLASEDSEYITGQVLAVNGGLYM